MHHPFYSVTSVSPDEFMEPPVRGHRAREPRVVLSAVAPCRLLEMVQVEGALSAVFRVKPCRRDPGCH